MQATPPQQQPRPWYKLFWPWFLITLPAVAVIASVYTLVLAVRSSDGLVDDDYYRQGQAINQDLRRDQAAHALGISAQMMLSDDGRDIRILLDKPLPNEQTLQLDLLHPTRAGQDRHLILQRQGPQMYSGRLAEPLTQPRWDIELGDTTNHWRLRGVWKIDPDKPLRLS